MKFLVNMKKELVLELLDIMIFIVSLEMIFVLKRDNHQVYTLDGFSNFTEVLMFSSLSNPIKVNTQITKKGKIKITNLDNFLLYRIVKVFYFI